MALFGFSDITFSKATDNTRGPLAALNRSEFERTTLRYPIDLGNWDKSHYLVFYIREQQATQFKGSTVADNLIDETGSSTGITSALSKLGGLDTVQSKLGGELLGKINTGLNSINQATGGKLSGITGAIGSAAGNVVGSINNLFGQANSLIGGNGAATQTIIDQSVKKITGGGISFLKTTKLTKDAIALYMPDTLTYTHAQSYDQLQLGGELGGKGLAAAQSAIEAYKKGDTEGAAKSIGKTAVLTAGQAATQAAGALLGSSQTAQAAFTAATGKVQNPMLEMLYKSPNFRTFQFDFSFYPRDEKEALEVQKIIERLKFHQAPEIVEETQGFLVPPSEFDIRFYYGGKQNPNIPSIATCVLTSIDVNYAPNGWSAYEVPGENSPFLGGTGMPVAIQISLQFQETTFLTKKDFKSDIGLKTQAK